ncbi:membrane protein [Xenorhabdus khoisanae]|uniref:Membrane protein n=1 Tax=Xenorhabdus khoisanae TaxID=880157 RepID=A0A0J5FVC0_9GAMM|nr:porin [Xenorhabdus khoisanae]KMJ46109.1 membrane protein [Xenorhabdus khoisanae]
MRSMKPLATLIGLLVMSGSANAATVYNDKGTKVDLTGQFRLKTTVSSEDRDIRIKDDGSRIGVNASHELTREIKVFGKMEWGSDTQKSNSDNNKTSFEMYNRVGYIGASHRDIGEMRVGRTYIPIDWVKKSSPGYGNTGVFYFGDVLSSATGYNKGGVGKNNFLTRLPQTLFFQTNSYKGFNLAATYSGKSGADNERQHGDIRSAYSVAGFYKSDFGLEASAGYAQATGESRKPVTVEQGDNKGESVSDAGLASPQDSLLALGVEYYFPGREFSVGFDYGLARSKNSGLVYKEGSGNLQEKSVKGDWKANLYGLAGKWHWDKIGSGMYAGYYLRDGDANTFNYKKQTYTVGLDKRFAVSKYNSLILFVETAYDDVRSDNPAYKNKKQTILGTGARLSF